MTWNNLLFMHWPVSPELLRSHIPVELELDRYDDRAWIGVVPFHMTGVGPNATRDGPACGSSVSTQPTGRPFGRRAASSICPIILRRCRRCVLGILSNTGVDAGRIRRLRLLAGTNLSASQGNPVQAGWNTFSQSDIRCSARTATAGSFALMLSTRPGLCNPPKRKWNGTRSQSHLAFLCLRTRRSFTSRNALTLWR